MDREEHMRPYKPRWNTKFEVISVYTEEEDLEALKKLLELVDLEHQQVTCIDITNLSDPEKSVLKLHPGTAINPKLSKMELDCATEAMNCKLRWKIREWEQHDKDYREGL